MALAAAAGAEAEGQVIALLSPHVLAALLLIPAAGPADAVELHQDTALPLIETLQVHPGAVGTMLVVAHHLLVVVLLQVNRPPKAADQGRGTRGFSAIGGQYPVLSYPVSLASFTGEWLQGLTA